MSSHRLALEPPSEPLALLDHALIDRTVQYARESPRRRVIAPLHRSETDALHRMLNAVQPDSYVRPHRHRDPPKAEAWIVLRGSLLFFTFSEDGAIEEQVALSAAGPRFGVDLVPGIYHSFIALEPDTVIYEVKSGPYVASNDKAFAPWSPPEGSDLARHYMQQLLAAARARDPSLPP
jgi:cupin fold WbuC family metalloprotein